MFESHQNRRLQVSVIRPRNSIQTPSKFTPRLSPTDSERSASFKTICRNNLRQYLINSTLHGLKYVGDNTITLFERIFFGLMVFIVVLLSAYFISNVYMKYSASPMIISLSSVSTDITSLPFPAVTVCNMNQAVKSVVAKTPVGSEEYSMVQSVCSTAVDENATNTMPGKWDEYQKLLVKVSQSCNDMLISCKYGGFDYKCTDIFITVLTDEGLCCTFNAVHKKFIAQSSYNTTPEFPITPFLESTANDWTPEKGFADERLKSDKYGYPRPVVGTGTHLGLDILLDGGISEYYCSSTSSYGFKILLHSPNEAPRITHFGTSLFNGFETRVVISPTISQATSAVRKMKTDIRQCLFESENILTYYRTYSRGNCEMECMAKIYLEHCECIQYYLPRFSDNITICGRKNADCVDKVTEQMQMHRNESFVCNCLPGCFEITYDAEISMAPLLPNAPILLKKELSQPNVSYVHIFYKNNFYRSQKKDELIGFTEFLSNTGGLLGLFMGFSVFSIVEVFYFLTIRPYSNHLKLSNGQRKRFNRMLKRFHKVRSRQILLHPNAENIETRDRNSVYPYVG